jgi:hypothetical protein
MSTAINWDEGAIAFALFDLSLRARPAIHEPGGRNGDGAGSEALVKHEKCLQPLSDGRNKLLNR